MGTCLILAVPKYFKEIEDLLFGNQALEPLVRLESVFKQRSVMSDSGASPGLDGCRQRGSASFGQRPGQGYLESAVRPDSTRDRLSLKDISSSLVSPSHLAQASCN